MKGKIAFEEHMAIEETLPTTESFAGESGPPDNLVNQLLDLGARRLENMDAAGIEFALQSLNAPGIQGILDTAEAIRVAKKGNDTIADAIARHPDRYGGLAALPMQDPDAASSRVDALRKGTRLQGGNGQWFYAEGRSGFGNLTTTSPSIEASGPPLPSWTCRFTFIPARRFRLAHRITKGIRGSRVHRGDSPWRLRFTRFVSAAPAYSMTIPA